MKNLQKFIKDESGATAIEYGLLAGLISVVAVASFSSAGSALKGIFSTVSTKLTSAQTAANAT